MSSFTNIGRPILIASHPRSGTHLTIDLLRKQFDACASWKYPGESLGNLYVTLEALVAPTKRISQRTALSVLRRSQRPILKTHDNPELITLCKQYPEWCEWVQMDADRLYVIRDGRAVMCSLHLFLQSFHPPSRCSFSEFLRQKSGGYTWVRHWANHVERWMAEPDVTTLQFETIVRHPDKVLATLSQTLNLPPKFQEPLLPQSFQNIWHSRWNRLTAWQPESTAILGYYKGQKKQRWQELFSPADREFFHQEAGSLLIHLGYETSEDWVTREDRPRVRL